MTRYLLLLLLCGCSHSDASPCERACDTLEVMRCFNYAPGECVESCEQFAALEPELAMQTAECVTTIESCGAVEACSEFGDSAAQALIDERDRYKDSLAAVADIAERQQRRAEAAEKRLAECEGGGE